MLAAIVNDLNKRSTVKGKSLLSLPASSIAQLSDGTYTLTVKVTNFLGQSATASQSFSKVGPGTAPVISIVGGNTQSFKIADGINLASALEPTSVCAGRTVSRWEARGTNQQQSAPVSTNLVLYCKRLQSLSMRNCSNPPHDCLI